MERDQMQSTLDDKSELCIRLEQRCHILEEELERQQSRIVEVQSRGDRGFETASSLEERLKDSQYRV
jgi:centrosomal protein CEP135